MDFFIINTDIKVLRLFKSCFQSHACQYKAQRTMLYAKYHDRYSFKQKYYSEFTNLLI